MKLLIADDGTLINADYMTMIGIFKAPMQREIMVHIRGRESDGPIKIKTVDTDEQAIEFIEGLAAEIAICDGMDSI